MTAPSDRVIPAGGGVVWRTGDDGTLETAVIHRPRYDDWSLPKGKLDRGEHVLQAAVREVAEETGLTTVVGRRSLTTRYPIPEATVDALTFFLSDVSPRAVEAVRNFVHLPDLF